LSITFLQRRRPGWRGFFHNIGQRLILTPSLSDCWAAMKGEPETLRARLDRTIQLIRRASGAEY
jgi:hypothetical protein